MGKARKHTPERIVNILRQVEVAVANGKTHPLASREGGITEQTHYRWRKEYGGLKVDQAKRLKELERENGKLKRLVAELSLDKQILQDIARGNFSARSGAVLLWNMQGNKGQVSVMRANWFISHAARSATGRHRGTTKTG